MSPGPGRRPREGCTLGSLRLDEVNGSALGHRRKSNNQAGDHRGSGVGEMERQARTRQGWTPGGQGRLAPLGWTAAMLLKSQAGKTEEWAQLRCQGGGMEGLE